MHRNQGRRCENMCRTERSPLPPPDIFTWTFSSLSIIGRPFVERFALRYQTAVCMFVLSVTLVYCFQTVGWIKMKLGMQEGLGPVHIVLDEDPAPLPKGAEPPFSAHICCGQMAGWIMKPLGRKVGRSPSDIALDGDPVPPFQKGKGELGPHT